MHVLNDPEVSQVSGGMRLDEFDPKVIDVLDQRTYGSTIRSYGVLSGT